jgi:hypothetical protein
MLSELDPPLWVNASDNPALWPGFQCNDAFPVRITASHVKLVMCYSIDLTSLPVRRSSRLRLDLLNHETPLCAVTAREVHLIIAPYQLPTVFSRLTIVDCTSVTGYGPERSPTPGRVNFTSFPIATSEITLRNCSLKGHFTPYANCDATVPRRVWDVSHNPNLIGAVDLRACPLDDSVGNFNVDLRCTGVSTLFVLGRDLHLVASESCNGRSVVAIDASGMTTPRNTHSGIVVFQEGASGLPTVLVSSDVVIVPMPARFLSCYESNAWACNAAASQMDVSDRIGFLSVRTNDCAAPGPVRVRLMLNGTMCESWSYGLLGFGPGAVPWYVEGSANWAAGLQPCMPSGFTYAYATALDGRLAGLQLVSVRGSSIVFSNCGLSNVDVSIVNSYPTDSDTLFEWGCSWEWAFFRRIANGTVHECRFDWPFLFVTNGTWQKAVSWVVAADAVLAQVTDCLPPPPRPDCKWSNLSMTETFAGDSLQNYTTTLYSMCGNQSRTTTYATATFVPLEPGTYCYLQNTQLTTLVVNFTRTSMHTVDAQGAVVASGVYDGVFALSPVSGNISPLNASVLYRQLHSGFMTTAANRGSYDRITQLTVLTNFSQRGFDTPQTASAHPLTVPGNVTFSDATGAPVVTFTRDACVAMPPVKTLCAFTDFGTSLTRLDIRRNGTAALTRVNTTGVHLVSVCETKAVLWRDPTNGIIPTFQAEAPSLIRCLPDATSASVFNATAISTAYFQLSGVDAWSISIVDANGVVLQLTEDHCEISGSSCPVTQPAQPVGKQCNFVECQTLRAARFSSRRYPSAYALLDQCFALETFRGVSQSGDLPDCYSTCYTYDNNCSQRADALTSAVACLQANGAPNIDLTTNRRIAQDPEECVDGVDGWRRLVAAKALVASPVNASVAFVCTDDGAVMVLCDAAANPMRDVRLWPCDPGLSHCGLSQLIDEARCTTCSYFYVPQATATPLSLLVVLAIKSLLVTVLLAWLSGRECTHRIVGRFANWFASAASRRLPFRSETALSAAREAIASYLDPPEMRVDELLDRLLSITELPSLHPQAVGFFERNLCLNREKIPRADCCRELRELIREALECCEALLMTEFHVVAAEGLSPRVSATALAEDTERSWLVGSLAGGFPPQYSAQDIECTETPAVSHTMFADPATDPIALASARPSTEAFLRETFFYRVHQWAEMPADDFFQINTTLDGHPELRRCKKRVLQSMREHPHDLETVVLPRGRLQRRLTPNAIVVASGCFFTLMIVITVIIELADNHNSTTDLSTFDKFALANFRLFNSASYPNLILNVVLRRVMRGKPWYRSKLLIVLLALGAPGLCLFVLPGAVVYGQIWGPLLALAAVAEHLVTRKCVPGGRLSFWSCTVARGIVRVLLILVVTATSSFGFNLSIRYIWGMPQHSMFREQRPVSTHLPYDAALQTEYEARTLLCLLDGWSSTSLSRMQFVAGSLGLY